MTQRRLQWTLQVILYSLLLYGLLVTLGGHAADPGVQPCPAVGECW